VGDLMLVLVTERAGQPEMGPGEFSGEFVARAGDVALLNLVAADQAPLVVPSAAEVRRRRLQAPHRVAEERADQS
jgi:hypothetical protein